MELVPETVLVIQTSSKVNEQIIKDKNIRLPFGFQLIGESDNDGSEKEESEFSFDKIFKIDPNILGEIPEMFSEQGYTQTDSSCKVKDGDTIKVIKLTKPFAGDGGYTEKISKEEKEKAAKDGKIKTE